MTGNHVAPDPTGSGNDKPVKTPVCSSEETELVVENLEDVIAPRIALNHNESVVGDEAISLHVEALEEVIAPKIAINHNETMVSDSR